MELPKSLLETVEQFTRLPGVGTKTALRQALMMTEWDEMDLKKLGASISALSSLGTCEKCGFFSDQTICSICSSTRRAEDAMICVVENVLDCMAIEKSEQFRGMYHVLGGVLNPLMGVGPDQLRISQLKERVHRDGIRSIILAINPSVEGDATCSYIKDYIGSEDVVIDRIGFGVPMGGSLEYLDPITIRKALENKRSF